MTKKYTFTGLVHRGYIIVHMKPDGKNNCIDLYDMLKYDIAEGFIRAYKDSVVTVELTFKDDVIKRVEDNHTTSIFNIKDFRVIKHEEV